MRCRISVSRFMPPDALTRRLQAIATRCDLAPDHPEILYNLANACLELGRLDEALANYDAALAKTPDHAGALVNRGNTLLRLNEPAKAIASYDAALVDDARSSADPDQSRPRTAPA